MRCAPSCCAIAPLRSDWPLRITPRADRHITSATTFYEAEGPRLQDRFIRDLDRVFDRVAENPFQFATISTPVRRAQLRDFPYGVFFRIQGDLVFILGVIHLHRHPDSWKR